LTFQNGKFGVFASRYTKCNASFVKLQGKCRRANVIYAKGKQVFAAAGTVHFTIKPTASASKALKKARKRRKGIPLTVIVTFQSSLGGSPVSHTQTTKAKLK